MSYYYPYRYINTQKKDYQTLPINLTIRLFSGMDKERNIISRIQVYVTVLTMLIIVGGFIIGCNNEDFAVVLIGFLCASIFYCIFKVLLLIADLLCDIRDNTSDKN